MMGPIDFTPLIFVGIFIGLALAGAAYLLIQLAMYLWQHIHWIS